MLGAGRNCLTNWVFNKIKLKLDEVCNYDASFELDKHSDG